MTIFRSLSPAQTKQIGLRVGRLLGKGSVVALIGDLGSGKTTFVKGLAKGLGVKDEKKIVSPTFVLIQEYQGKQKIYHMDWYRLDTVKGSDAASAMECFESDAVSLVEWADRGKAMLPKEHLRITFKHKTPTSREIVIQPLGIKYKTCLKNL